MSATTPPVSRSDIRRMIELVCPPDGILEMRVLGVPRIRVAAGYFDDLDAALAAAERWNARGAGVYVTFNVVKRAMLARAANRIVEAPAQTTGDADVEPPG